MTPLAFKMTPTPSEMAFDPPTQISSFLSWRRFFLEKKNLEKKILKKKFMEKKILKKKFLEKFFSPADAGASFRPKKPKSAIKNVSPAPLSTPLRRFFMTPPLAIFFYGPPLAQKSLHTYALDPEL